jgi:hypothetical protein
VGNLESFRLAGRTLFSLGLVRQSEGNLSTFDGSRLRITRTGACLDALGEADVLSGSLHGELPGASSDLEVHRQMYRDRGPGAVAHAHPAGSVPEEGSPSGEHGVYEFGDTLDAAVSAAVMRARELAGASSQEVGS